jgi:hypothetical protein
MKDHAPCRFTAFLLAATSMLFSVPALAAGPLIFSCSADNDLFRVASDNGVDLKRFDTPRAAVEAAEAASAALRIGSSWPA